MRQPESWGHSTVRTACPLDCPDSCTIDVTVENGRVVKIDGGDENPVTRDFICGKVRRFADRIYGEDRLLYPAVRQGAKGQGTFSRVTWGEALDLIATRMEDIRDHKGAEAILPFCYGGSNGLLTQDTNDAALFRAFGTSRLARTVCAAPTGAANMALYGKMPGVTYQDYVHARLIVLWGVNPAASGIHLVPFLREAQKPGARWSSSIRARRRLHAGGSPSGRAPGHRSRRSRSPLHRFLFEEGHADQAFLAEHTTGADSLRARAARMDVRTRGRRRRHRRRGPRALRRALRRRSPALIRCGWGLERNRNGGTAAAAVMALPRSPASSACAAAGTR